MDSTANFFQWFSLGISSGFAVGFIAFMVGRVVRRSFSLVGRSALMRF